MYKEDMIFKAGKRRRVVYYQGRRHLIFTAKYLRSMRVWPSADSDWCHLERFFR